MLTQLQKWLAFYSPLLRGRFDFTSALAGRARLLPSRGTDANGSRLLPSREAWHQGLALTGGRFWVRLRGGHDLRRIVGPAADWTASRSDAMVGCSGALAKRAGVLVGRADGPAETVTTFPWVCHAADTEYRYALSVVGAGGVMDFADAPQARAAFDADGALVAPAPNRVGDLVVRPLSGGRFELRWTYDETDEETPPAQFRIYSDAGSPGTIDYDIPVGTVPYRFRRGFFAWTSPPFADGTRLTWSLRAASSTGPEGPPSPPAFAVARAACPPPPQIMN